MNLCQEYLDRHSIKLPVVHLTSSGYVFLKTKNPKNRINWSVVSLAYHDGRYHPGTYSVNWSKPVHNGSCSRGRPLDNYDQRRLEWDEYEDYFLNWTKDFKTSRVISDKKEIVIVAWEMFVYSNDTALSNYAHREDFFNSLDNDLSIEERFEACENVIESMVDDPHSGNLRRNWEREMMLYVREYSHWLAELSNAES